MISPLLALIEINSLCRAGHALTCTMTFSLRRNGWILDPAMVVLGRGASEVPMITAWRVALTSDATGVISKLGSGRVPRLPSALSGSGTLSPAPARAPCGLLWMSRPDQAWCLGLRSLCPGAAAMSRHWRACASPEADRVTLFSHHRVSVHRSSDTEVSGDTDEKG